MGFEYFKAAENRVSDKKDREYVPVFAISPEFVDYILKLQNEIEERGAAAYETCARDVWERFTGSAPLEDDPNFREFEHGMIRDLHSVDWEDAVYPDVTESLPKLIEKWSESVRKAAFSSAGAPAEYRIRNIDSTGIVPQFMKGILGELSNEDARKFLEDKIEYLMADNTFEHLGGWLKGELKKESGEIKLVIVGNSPDSFIKAKRMIQTCFPEEARRIKLVPVWAVYSQEGREIEERAKTHEEKAELWEKKHDFHAIASFSDLLKEEYGEIMKGAYLLVDFDGAVGDTLLMRKRQAEAVYNSFVHAYANSQMISANEADKRMREYAKK